MPLGFDASGKHILTFQRSSSQSGYSEQILVFDFDAAHGVATFNNSNLVIPPHSSDANPLLLSGELLFSRNGQGLVSSYELDSSKGTLRGPVASFSVNSDFTIPYIADGITDTLISLGMQSNNVASFRLNMTDGTLQNSNGPYQAGSAPEFMAVAHQ
jgi:6-phosphogluconolactonase (cycloisomerase 2 family)